MVVGSSNKISAFSRRNLISPLLVFLVAFTWLAESSEEKAEQEFRKIQGALDRGEIGFSSAIRRYRRIIKNYPESEFSAGASYATGGLFEKVGKVEEACIAYVSVAETYPDSEWFSPAVQDLLRIGYDLFNLKKKGLLKNTYEQARKIFRKVLEVAPSIENRGEIQYSVGYCSLQLGEYEEAVFEFQKIIESRPEESLLEKAEYQLGVSFLKQSLPAQRDQTMTDRAIVQFSHFLTKYPQSELAEDAKEKMSMLRDRRAESLYSICLFYMKQKEKRALLFYSGELIRDFPETEWADLARKLLET